MLLHVDFDILQSSTAQSLNRLDIAKFLPGYRLSATAAINEELLTATIKEKLHQLEHQLFMTENEVTHLELLISYFPKHTDFGLEASYRVAQLRVIVELKSEIEALKNYVQSDGPAGITVERITSIRETFDKCLNSPLKQDLLATFNGLVDAYTLGIAASQSEEQTELPPLTIEAVDDHLIGLMIPEYINVETSIRLAVAKRVFEQGMDVTSPTDELIGEVKKLISEYMADNQMDEEDTEESETKCLVITEITEGIEIVDGQIRLR